MLLAPAAEAKAAPGKSPVLPWAIAAAALLAAVGLGYVAWQQASGEPSKTARLRFEPPEGGLIDVSNGPSIALSPDGTRIVFRAIVDGKPGLWIRDIDSLIPRPLTGADGAIMPFWAPDNRNLGFFRNGKLMRVDVTGGPALTVADAPAGRGGTWNEDDVIIFAPTASSGLSRVAAAGGTPTALLERNSERQEQSLRFPWLLPDGRHFLYTARSGNEENTGVFAGDLESKEVKLIVAAASNSQYVEPGYLLYVRERTLMAQPFDAAGLAVTGPAVPIAEQVDYRGGPNAYGFFSASQNGVIAYTSGGTTGALQIGFYDRSGMLLGKIGKPADIQTPRLSPDGKMVATDRADSTSGNRDIWLLDIVRGTEQRLTFADSNTYPVWSPDGKRIAYSRRPANKIVVKNADGTGNEDELESAEKLPMDWTRDGKFLLTASPNNREKTGNDIWALPLAPDKPAAAGQAISLKETEFAEWHPRVSPDGRWLAFDTNENKQKEIAVVGFPSLNGHWQISTNGGRYPVWSRDGRELYYVSTDGKLMAVGIQSGPVFQAGVPKPLFDIRLGTSNPSFDVSADGRFLIAAPIEENTSVPVTVVLNWQSALR